jgi:hypothetical protein
VEEDSVRVSVARHSDDQTAEVEIVEPQTGDLNRAEPVDGHERDQQPVARAVEAIE